MLKRYKTVSIIYGGTGAQYAAQMHELIMSRSGTERYPINAKIVMENVLTGDLLANVTKLFVDSEFCLTFLTADDICVMGDREVRRVRQNVVFELGMAIFRLGREKCILLSDFDPWDKTVELPSDLKGIDIKYFTPETREQVFGEVLDKILRLSARRGGGGAPRYDHLLDRREYFVDYEDLFASCSHLEAQEGNAYLKSVLQYWLAESASFTHYEERGLYFLERIGFLPMFGRHRWVHDWCVAMEEQLAQFNREDISYCGKRKLDFIHNLALTVSSITRMKLQGRYEPNYDDYQELLDQLLMESVEEVGIANPLVATVYYDYMGLLHMYLYELRKEPEQLQSAIDCFGRVMQDHVERTDMSLGIWAGFVGYNLARCYVKMYHTTGEGEHALQAQKLMMRASMIRKRWISGGGFHSTIRNALSYEYFICKIEQISAMKLMASRSDDAIRKEFKRLEGELEGYMSQEEQLERLRFVQTLLDRRQNELTEQDAISEGDL